MATAFARACRQLLSELQNTLNLFKKDFIFVKWHKPFASNGILFAPNLRAFRLQ